VVQPSLRFTLSFIEGNGVLQLEDRPLAVAGLAERLSLEIPGLRFPFDLSGGLTRFQNRHCRLRELVLSFTGAEIAKIVQGAPLADFGILDPIVELASGGLRLGARAVVGGCEAHFTARATVRPSPPASVVISFDDLRLYGFLPVPAPLLVRAVFAALGADRPLASWAAGALALVGPTRLELAALELSLFPLLPANGWRLPDWRQVSLQSVQVGADGLQLHFLRQPADPAAATAGEEGPTAAAEAAILSGDLTFARTAYRQAHTRAPEEEQSRLRLLQLLAASPERLDELDEAARAMAQATPDHPTILLAQALVAGQQGQPAVAARLYLRVAELAETAGESLDAACARRAAATELLRSEQREAATAELERAHAGRPDHRGVMRALGERLRAEERWEDLLGLLGRQASVESGPPERAALLSASGLVLLEQPGKTEAARERFEQALHLHSEDPGAWEGFGRLNREKGDRASAIASLQQAARLYAKVSRPDGQARVEAVLGILEEASGDPEGALARFRRAAELDPAAVDPVVGGADLLSRLSRLPEAAELLQQALGGAVEPAGRVRLCRRLSVLEREGRGDLVAARQWLEQALRERAADVGALEDLARLLETQGEPEQLEPFLRRAAGAAAPGLERRRVGRLCEQHGRQHGWSALEAEGLALLAAEGGRQGAERALALAELGERLENGALMRRAADAIEGLLASEAGGAEPLPVARLANRLALLRLRQGDRTASEDLSHRALASYPDPDAATQAWQTIVRCALERGDVAATRAGLAAWAEDGRVADPPPARAARLVEAGSLERERLGSAAQAASLFDRALALDPDNRTALEGLAAALEERQQWPRLEEILQRMLSMEADPGATRELRHRLAEALVRRGGRAEDAARLYELLQGEQPDDPRAALGLGRAFWQAGRLEESVAQFERVAAADQTGAAEAHLRLAQAARLFGEVAKADRHLQQAVEAEPARGAPSDVLVEVLESFGQTEDLVGLLERRRAGAASARHAQELARSLGGVLERVGRADDAVAVYRALLQASPEDLESLERLAEIFRRESRKVDLLGPLERLLQLATEPAHSGNPPLAEGIDVEAIGLELAGILEDAGSGSDRIEAVLRRVLAVRPDSTDVLLALFARLDRQPDRSSEAFATLALLYRQNLRTHRGLELDRSLAALAESPGVDAALAAATLEEAVSQGGGAILVDALVSVYQRVPAEADPLERLRILVQRSPDLEGAVRVRVHTILASAAEERNDWATAVSELGHALAFDTDPEQQAGHLVARGRVRILAGDIQQGQRDLKAALQHRPADAEALLLLADLAETDQDWGTALQLLDRLATAEGAEGLISPERLAYRQAMAALRAGDATRAAAGLKEVLAIDPDHLHAREVLVDVHLRTGDLEGARAELERLTAAHPERTVSWTALGELYERLGLYREAAHALGGLARALAEPRPRAEALLRRGDLLRDRLADPGAAQDAYRLALDADPTFARATVRIIETRWRAGHLGSEALADRMLDLARQLGEDEQALAQALDALLADDPGGLAGALREVLDRRAAEGSPDRAVQAVRRQLRSAGGGRAP
jgi:cellulose synthase operon protein C